MKVASAAIVQAESSRVASGQGSASQHGRNDSFAQMFRRSICKLQGDSASPPSPPEATHETIADATSLAMPSVEPAAGVLPSASSAHEGSTPVVSVLLASAASASVGGLTASAAAYARAGVRLAAGGDGAGNPTAAGAQQRAATTLGSADVAKQDANHRPIDPEPARAGQGPSRGLAERQEVGISQPSPEATATNAKQAAQGLNSRTTHSGPTEDMSPRGADIAGRPHPTEKPNEDSRENAVAVRAVIDPRESTAEQSIPEGKGTSPARPVVLPIPAATPARAAEAENDSKVQPSGSAQASVKAALHLTNAELGSGGGATHHNPTLAYGASVAHSAALGGATAATTTVCVPAARVPAPVTAATTTTAAVTPAAESRATREGTPVSQAFVAVVPSWAPATTTATATPAATPRAVESRVTREGTPVSHALEAATSTPAATPATTTVMESRGTSDSAHLAHAIATAAPPDTAAATLPKPSTRAVEVRATSDSARLAYAGGAVLAHLSATAETASVPAPATVAAETAPAVPTAKTDGARANSAFAMRPASSRARTESLRPADAAVQREAAPVPTPAVSSRTPAGTRETRAAGKPSLGGTTSAHAGPTSSAANTSVATASSAAPAGNIVLPAAPTPPPATGEPSSLPKVAPGTRDPSVASSGVPAPAAVPPPHPVKPAAGATPISAASNPPAAALAAEPRVPVATASSSPTQPSDPGGTPSPEKRERARERTDSASAEPTPPMAAPVTAPNSAAPSSHAHHASPATVASVPEDVRAPRTEGKESGNRIAPQASPPSQLAHDVAQNGARAEAQVTASPPPIQAAVTPSAHAPTSNISATAALADPRGAAHLPAHAAPLAAQIARDEGLNMTVLPHAAHMAIESPEGDLALHMRVREGSAEITMGGSMAHLFEARAPEARAALASEGLALGRFDSGQPGGGQHGQPAPETPERADEPPAPYRPNQGASPPTPAQGRIHVTA